MSIKLAIYAHTPIAGAPWNQYLCLKKYAKDIDVRFIQQRTQYKDGRNFPKDMLLTDRAAIGWLRQADVVHIHNYLPAEVRGYLSPRKQRIVATLHSVPRQGNWQEVMKFAHRVFCIKQPMQMREYNDLESLPNLFDVWAYTPPTDKVFTDGPLNIVYCPTNKHANNVTASKGYHTVMPLLKELKKERGNDVNIISFTNVEYQENLRMKSAGHMTIDDICGATFHLTSLEACCTKQAVLTSCPKDWGYPFVYTTLSNIREKIEYFLDNRDKLDYSARMARTWVEQQWNPEVLVQDYIKAYTF